MHYFAVLFVGSKRLLNVSTPDPPVVYRDRGHLEKALQVTNSVWEESAVFYRHDI
jgi:hypothetical protein